uniref:Photosystem II reaction center PsbP family protein n=1 Tax=Melianthus villosus TaxID=377280 RepID=A0A0F7GYG9_9ROSI
MAILLSLTSSIFPPSPNAPQNPKPNTTLSTFSSKRHFLLTSTSLCTLLLTPISSAEPSSPKKSTFSGIASTRSWFQFFGNGFAIRVPPQFEDVMEPEDYNAGLSLYGDKVKPKTFAARFASPDGLEVLSVVIRPSNLLKITFLEAKDVTDLGSLKEAAKLFVPGGSNLYSARTIKVKEEEGFRTYYYYEFGKYEQHVALVAAVNSGKAFIAGATAPESKWDDDGVRLRSAAVSLSVL